jgi:protein pelota
MRLIKQNIERDGSGSITFFPEEPEDMVRNLLVPPGLLLLLASSFCSLFSTVPTYNCNQMKQLLLFTPENRKPQSKQLITARTPVVVYLQPHPARGPSAGLRSTAHHHGIQYGIHLFDANSHHSHYPRH